MGLKDQITDIFVQIDDFCKEFAAEIKHLSKALWEMLFADGIQLFTKLRKNMKNHIMKMVDKILLHKRAIIEMMN